MLASPSTNTRVLCNTTRLAKRPRFYCATKKYRQSKVNAPLGKALEVVTAGSLVLEARDTEPRGLLVLTAAGVRCDGILENLAAGRGCAELGGSSKVADESDLGHGPRRGGAEGTGEAWGGNGTTGEERHCVRLLGVAEECLEEKRR